MHTRRIIGPALLLVALISAAALGAAAPNAALPAAPSPRGPASPSPVPPVDLYVLAPTAKAAEFSNMLPVEAALRSVAIELAAKGAYVVYVPIDQLAALPKTAYPRLELVWPASEEGLTWKAAFSKSWNESDDLGGFVFQWDNWGKLTASATSVSDSLLKSLEGRIKFAARPAEPALTDRERRTLDDAFAAVCNDGPSKALWAAQEVDDVLTAHPSSADARRAAVWPSAILATQDLYGHLQLRQRFLAVPLAWWVAAERASKAKDTRATLTESWLALLCGFPKETLAIVSKLPAADASQPLAEALVMFATRDYRPLDNGKAVDAPAIKQLAWIWALQDCYLFEPRNETVLEIMNARESVAFGPVYGVPGVASGHMFCAEMTNKGTRDVVESILGLDAIPAEPRKSLQSELTVSSGSANGESEIWPGMPVSRSVKFFNAAASLALKSPDGPQRVKDSTLVWQSLSPWAYGQVERGLGYQMLQLEGRLLSRVWGVEQEAIAFFNGVVLGFDESSGASYFFQILAGAAASKQIPGEVFQKEFAAELGFQPPQWALLGAWESQAYLDMARKHENVTHHPCGAWEAWMCILGSDTWKIEDDKMAWYTCATSNDEYNHVRGMVMFFEDVSEDYVRALAEKVSYDLGLVTTLAQDAHLKKHDDLAVELYLLCIKDNPKSVTPYNALYRIYDERGEKDKAIAILKESAANTEFTVESGNMMSDLAKLLLDQGKTDEAYVWAKKGAETYSSLGLTTYGLVLFAQGKSQEGLKYYRLEAERYGDGYEYVIRAFICKTPPQDVIDEVKRILEMTDNKWYRESMLSALAVHGQFDAARELLDADGGINNDVRRESLLGAFSLTEGRFDDSVKHFRAAVDAHVLDMYKDSDAVFTAQQAYIAALFAGDRALKMDALRFFASYKGKYGDFEPMIRYFQFSLTREQALEAAKGSYRATLNLNWIFAAESEAAGDVPKAIEYYKAASVSERADWAYAGYFARQRLKTLKAVAAPDHTSAPAPVK